MPGWRLQSPRLGDRNGLLAQRAEYAMSAVAASSETAGANCQYVARISLWRYVGIAPEAAPVRSNVEALEVLDSNIARAAYFEN